MCYDISSENLLANFFASHGADKVSIGELKLICKKIEETFDFRLYVNLTFESLLQAQENFPRIFYWNDDWVERGPDATGSFFSNIDKDFNWRVPQDVRSEYKEIIANYHI